MASKETQKGSRGSAGGRPRKFTGPSRPIPITLPETTLRSLERIDHDRGRAIVKLTEQAFKQNGTSKQVEVVEVAENVGLVVVGPTQALKQIPFLHLVEVAAGRF